MKSANKLFLLHFSFFFASCFLYPVSGLSQVTLKSWVQVFGTVEGEELGKHVTGIVPSGNFPYRGAVSKDGVTTGVYSLEDQSDTTVRGEFPGANFLTGDLNADGNTDVVITKTVGGWDTVYVYWGTETGIDTLAPLTIAGENNNDFFAGRCIADVNNDGFEDLIATAVSYPFPSEHGKVYVFLNPVDSPIPDATTEGEAFGYRLGKECAVGDLNGDMLNDLIFRGGSQTLSYSFVNVYYGVEVDTLDLEVGVQLKGSDEVFSGLACFDVNGDSIDDLLWTNRDSTPEDWIYVHYGGATFDTIPSLRLADPRFALFGNVIANAGDMNGDGYDDIVVGSYISITSGFVFVFGGGPEIDGEFDAAVGMSSDSWFGYSVDGVGDVNGDGLDDIIVGAPNYDFGRQKGYWGIFLGDSSMIVSDVKDETIPLSVARLYQSYPNPFNPLATISYDVNRTAHVRLDVFDITGSLLVTLVDREQVPGNHEATFDGEDYASGVYHYRLSAVPLKLE